MKKLITTSILGFLLAVGCKPEKTEESGYALLVSNELDFERNEIVSFEAKKLLAKFEDTSIDDIHIKDSTGKTIRHQWVDYDKDGKPEEFLFMAKVGANKTSTYKIVSDSSFSMPEKEAVAYSRFVPERTDDYAWENDKVAFRTYGPTGQKEALEGVAGSTLSSGIDVWLKRTNKSIINKWYAEHVKNPGYYHTDHGEGYDPYHVGNSRGLGGIGIFEDDSLYVSQNFMEYKTIVSGPLKTIFELSYDPWGPYKVKETKRISLALGSHFSKFEIRLESVKDVPNYAAGITLHNNEGEYKINKEEGWIMHWESIDDTKVGEGIVMQPAEIDSAFAYISKVPDQSNLLITTTPKSTFTYYAGFAWEKSGDVSSKEDWIKMLQKQAKIITSPLKVDLEKALQNKN
ncbi:DUF4861 family protein [Zunongwangia pacifica]|uniref:DUF4861 domain-containing protein n=1 Tax=Zunongwangia pacifica TaxID=2911062 RepID=A0A9X1ZX93_9FLAO|nr:DUF4861 family protein [Zunongwangia pacifica]MCL6218081.1 DUF4861 domain-containing protein [Zunongwangia pacifica]